MDTRRGWVHLAPAVHALPFDNTCKQRAPLMIEMDTRRDGAHLAPAAAVHVAAVHTAVAAAAAAAVAAIVVCHKQQAWHRRGPSLEQAAAPQRASCVHS
eukprot:1161394-Pelagomonas_calceolata.AAC.12